MRHSKLTADKIFEAEKAADDRKQTRKSGFAKMKERDQGNTILHDFGGKARVLRMRWGLPDDDMFALDVVPYKENGSPVTLYLSAEEFRKWLRWV